jgi:hypothetical protein
LQLRARSNDREPSKEFRPYSSTPAFSRSSTRRGYRHAAPTHQLSSPCHPGIRPTGRRGTQASPDCRLLAGDGEADHLHLLAYPLKLSVSVPGNARHVSRRLRRNRPNIASRYHDGVLWSPAYSAASAGDWRSSSSMSSNRASTPARESSLVQAGSARQALTALIAR